MLHTLFMYYKNEADALKSTARCENFDSLKPLLQKRTLAIEIEDRNELQASYTELFREIKKRLSLATKHYQGYLINRSAVIKKIEIEIRTVESEPLLADYIASLKTLIEDLLNFDAELDIKFLKKLEETLGQEKAGFSQQSLFAFFQADPHDVIQENKFQLAGAK